MFFLGNFIENFVSCLQKYLVSRQFLRYQNKINGIGWRICGKWKKKRLGLILDVPEMKSVETIFLIWNQVYLNNFGLLGHYQLRGYIYEFFIITQWKGAPLPLKHQPILYLINLVYCFTDLRRGVGTWASPNLWRWAGRGGAKWKPPKKCRKVTVREYRY